MEYLDNLTNLSVFEKSTIKDHHDSSNLQNFSLTGYDKNWIAREILLHRSKPRYWVSKLNISRHTIRKWCVNIQKGVINHNHAWRPDSLDEISLKTAAKICKKNPYFCEMRIRAEISMQYKETKIRSKLGVLHDPIKPLTRKTKKKYVAKLAILSENDDLSVGSSENSENDIIIYNMHH